MSLKELGPVGVICPACAAYLDVPIQVRSVTDWGSRSVKVEFVTQHVAHACGGES